MVKGWKIVALGDIADFVGGSQPPLTTFIDHEAAGYVRLIQIRDYKTDKYLTCIPVLLARRFCNHDDIMIGRYGPPIFQILRGLEGAYNVALIKTIPKDIDKEFLFYTLKRNDLFVFVELLSRRSSGQTGVDLANLRSYELAIPIEKSEQSAIATALSDMDTYIAALEKLIDKKKAIKHGAMQELLTGKRRLPGFREEWVYANLGRGDLAQFDYENLGVGTDLDYSFKYITLENVDNGVLKGTVDVVFSNASPRARRVVHQNDILISTVRPHLHSHLMVRTTVKDTICSTGFCVINTNAKLLENTFLFYLFFSAVVDKQIETITAGSNYPAINSKDIKRIEIPLPRIEEQSAIASILTDMDAEIEAFTAKMNKAKLVKQGMMQELLTGRIQLIDEDA